jgi:hypothetical protein
MAQAMTTEQLQEQQRRLTVYQARYDDVLQPWGRKAPEPVLTEGPGTYRRRVLSHAQLFLPEGDQWRGVDVNDIGSDALSVVEQQILGALRTAQRTPALVASSAAGRPDSVTPGLRVVEHHDANGLVQKTFHGEWFGKMFCRPCRRVTSFLTQHGHVDSSGRALRRG